LKTASAVRVHRSAIVNVDRIKQLEPWFHGEYVVILKDGTKLTCCIAWSTSRGSKRTSGAVRVVAPPAAP
jgi:LytTr DNA-binding domain